MEVPGVGGSPLKSTMESHPDDSTMSCMAFRRESPPSSQATVDEIDRRRKDLWLLKAAKGEDEVWRFTSTPLTSLATPGWKSASRGGLDGIVQLSNGVAIGYSCIPKNHPKTIEFTTKNGVVGKKGGFIGIYIFKKWENIWNNTYKWRSIARTIIYDFPASHRLRTGGQYW